MKKVTSFNSNFHLIIKKKTIKVVIISLLHIRKLRLKKVLVTRSFIYLIVFVECLLCSRP